MRLESFFFFYSARPTPKSGSLSGMSEGKEPRKSLFFRALSFKWSLTFLVFLNLSAKPASRTLLIQAVQICHLTFAFRKLSKIWKQILNPWATLPKQGVAGRPLCWGRRFRICVEKRPSKKAGPYQTVPKQQQLVQEQKPWFQKWQTN